MFWIFCPTKTAFLEEFCVIAVCIRISNIYCLFNRFFFTFLVYNSLFDFFFLDVVSEFLIQIRSKSFYYPTAVFFEACVNCCICSCQSNISLSQNIIGCYNSCNRQRTKNHRRSIQFDQFYTSLSINDR